MHKLCKFFPKAACALAIHLVFLFTVFWEIIILFVSRIHTYKTNVFFLSSSFLFYSHLYIIIFTEYSYILALVHAENTLLGFLTYSAVDALRCIELARGEFLLVFHTLAVYVDSQGRKSRDREIMYPAVPTAVSKYRLTNINNYIIIYIKC